MDACMQILNYLGSWISVPASARKFACRSAYSPRNGGVGDSAVIDAFRLGVIAFFAEPLWLTESRIDSRRPRRRRRTAC